MLKPVRLRIANRPRRAFSMFALHQLIMSNWNLYIYIICIHTNISCIQTFHTPIGSLSWLLCELPMLLSQKRQILIFKNLTVYSRAFLKEYLSLHTEGGLNPNVPSFLPSPPPLPCYRGSGDPPSTNSEILHCCRRVFAHFLSKKLGLWLGLLREKLLKIHFIMIL